MIRSIKDGDGTETFPSGSHFVKTEMFQANDTGLNSFALKVIYYLATSKATPPYPQLAKSQTRTDQSLRMYQAG
jgi:hypothetical protein